MIGAVLRQDELAGFGLRRLDTTRRDAWRPDSGLECATRLCDNHQLRDAHAADADEEFANFSYVEG
jgi:hypothetical protein